MKRVIKPRGAQEESTEARSWRRMERSGREFMLKRDAIQFLEKELRDV